MQDTLRRMIPVIMILCLIWPIPSEARVKPAPVFQSHMVLQRDMPINVWGTAEAGELVRVSLGREKKEIHADNKGEWILVFPRQKASYDPVELVVNELVFTNILIGEVWICSGQSNMAWVVGKSDVPDKMGIIENREIRYLKLVGPKGVAKDGYSREELVRCKPDEFFKGRWTPGTSDRIPLFSALGWMFAQNLAADLDVPVGIIEIAVGGSAINNWLPPEVTRSHPYTSHMYQEDWLTNTKVFINHRRRGREAFQHVLKKDEPFIPGAMEYRWMCEPSFLYEAGMETLGKLGIRGLAWYQGESDAYSKEPVIQYPELFRQFIASVRKEFRNERLPVLFVQLPGHKPETWPLFREMQRQVSQSERDVYMAVAIDLGEEDNIHPRDKTQIGNRLSALALKHVYHRKGQPDFPELEKIKIKAEGVELVFSNCGKGLTGTGKPVPHFELAGADNLFLPAEASVISRRKILVKPGGIQADYIRYGWKSFPKPAVSVYNSDGFPLGPFIESLKSGESERIKTR